jgi:hypothetical protein
LLDLSSGLFSSGLQTTMLHESTGVWLVLKDMAVPSQFSIRPSLLHAVFFTYSLSFNSRSVKHNQYLGLTSEVRCAYKWYTYLKIYFSPQRKHNTSSWKG